VRGAEAAARREGRPIVGVGGREVARLPMGVAAQLERRGGRGVLGAIRFAVTLDRKVERRERLARGAEPELELAARLGELGAERGRLRLALECRERIAGALEVAGLRAQAGKRDAQVGGAELAGDRLGRARGGERGVAPAELERGQSVSSSCMRCSGPASGPSAVRASCATSSARR
jgi:hypothetical protein